MRRDVLSGGAARDVGSWVCASPVGSLITDGRSPFSSCSVYCWVGGRIPHSTLANTNALYNFANMSSIARGIIVPTAHICELFLNNERGYLCYTHKYLCLIIYRNEKSDVHPGKTGLFCTDSTDNYRLFPMLPLPRRQFPFVTKYEKRPALQAGRVKAAVEKTRKINGKHITRRQKPGKSPYTADNCEGHSSDSSSRQ